MSSHLFERRFAAFAVGLAAAAVMLGWAARTSWQGVERLHEELSRETIDRFNIADEFRANLQELNSLLLHYELRPQQSDWSLFLRKRGQLNDWLERQHQRVRTPREQSALKELDTAFDDFEAATDRIRTEVGRATGWPKLGDFVEAAGLQTDRLSELDAHLLRAHDAALQEFLDQSRSRLDRLRSLMGGALAVILALGLWLAIMVFRDLIQPLRRELVESRDIIERQEKLASLGVLAAGVAHEIRNPLTAIKARLFTQQKDLPTSGQASDDARVISSEINRLERIVKGFLDFARPAEPVLETIAVGPFLTQVGDLIAPDCAERGTRFELQPVPAADLRADRGQLTQVLLNLIRNAAEATGRGGHVRLGARTGIQRLRPGLVPVVVLEVADDGKGIEPGIRERLFDPFFTTKADGTGLGLSIAARIVEKHGGALEFQTEPGHGTTFGIVLPRLLPAEPPAP